MRIQVERQTARAHPHPRPLSHTRAGRRGIPRAGKGEFYERPAGCPDERGAVMRAMTKAMVEPRSLAGAAQRALLAALLAQAALAGAALWILDGLW